MLINRALDCDVVFALIPLVSSVQTHSTAHKINEKKDCKKVFFQFNISFIRVSFVMQDSRIVDTVSRNRFTSSILENKFF